MADEQGVKTDDAAAAGQQGQSGQANGLAARQADQTEQAVPYERFKQVNEAKSRTETENAVLREQLKIMAANPQQNAPAAGQGYNPPDYMTGLEIDDDEQMSGADVKKALQHVAGNIDRRYAATAAAMQFQVSHQDYPTVVGADGAMAPALTKYLQKNPLALNQIQQHPNPTAYLYTLGKAAIEAEKAEKPPAKGEGADEGRQTPPASPSMVGGGTSGIKTGSRFQQGRMSKEDLEKFVASVKSGTQG